MNFRSSFCDPLKPEIIELGDIKSSQVIDAFEQTDWQHFLRNMDNATEEEIHYSPSLEIENKTTRHGITISAVGSPQDYEFYIFYKRPETVKSFFGLKERMDENYVTDKTGQTKQDVIECLQALIEDDIDFLARKIGK